MDVGELGVGVFEVRHRDLSGRPGRAAVSFGDAELDAVGHLDARAVLGPGHRAADRFADRLDDAGHPDMTAPGFDIDGDSIGRNSGFPACSGTSPKRPTIWSSYHRS